MSKVRTFFRLLKTPGKLVKPLGNIGLFNWMPDKMYLKMLYYCEMGRKLDLDNPISFNEKLQWLKLYNRNPKYSLLVDKYEVKSIVGNLIGEEYIIKTYGVWDSVDEIDWSILPNRFVIKCTHDSGSVIICKDKQSFDVNQARQCLQKALHKNTYSFGREWPYKNVKPRIIVEEFLDNGSDTPIPDYKVLCFNGMPKLIEYHQNRYTSRHTQDFYDVQWKRTEIKQIGEPMADSLVSKPQKFEQMLQLSSKLAQEIPHVRVDWYELQGRLYFGELTFFDASGLCPFENYEYDILLGSWIQLDLNHQ